MSFFCPTEIWIPDIRIWRQLSSCHFKWQISTLFSLHIGHCVRKLYEMINQLQFHVNWFCVMNSKLLPGSTAHPNRKRHHFQQPLLDKVVGAHHCVQVHQQYSISKNLQQPFWQLRHTLYYMRYEIFNLNFGHFGSVLLCPLPFRIGVLLFVPS